MIRIELTEEQKIAKHYSAAMDSVNLINSIAQKSVKTQDDLDTIKRNVEHLKIIIVKDFWTTEDLTPLQSAILIGG